MRTSVGKLLTFLALSSWCATSAAQVPNEPWWPVAPPLPPPAGQVIRVENVEQLFRAAHDIRPGGTILVADGRYRMPRYFELATDDVTLRGESGQRDRVVLDGRDSRHGELVGVSNCRGVTIADLTIENIKWNGFKINSNKRASHVTIRNCVIHNIWQRGIKGPAVDPEDRGAFWPTACRILYCLFYNDRPKQFEDDPTDTAETFNGNYVGGIDAMNARQWVIADNVFVGVHGRTGEGRGAIFLWNESHDCVVERNVIVDCDVGIALGNHYRHSGTRWHDKNCVVRNNFVTRCAETGILAAHTRDCHILHNTVYEPYSRLRRLIWVQDDNEGLLVANNLLCGPDVLDTGTSKIAQRDNLADPELADQFLDLEGGNLRLARAVMPTCERLEQAKSDVNRHIRPARAMPGAHEFIARRAAIYSPRILVEGMPDTYSLRTFGQTGPWRQLAGDERAYAIYRYLADTHTGLFHMNVVAEGDDGLGEFMQVRDPVKILNVYGYGYCGILGPVMAGICEEVGLGPARTLVLPAWNHVAAETFYDQRWHYLDLDVRAVFRRDDGTLASMQEAKDDASLWRDRGPFFFPNDPLDRTRTIYQETTVQTYHGFHQSGHTMDYLLRPGERFTRWWTPQGGRWHHLKRYNDTSWLRELLESPPRGPKPNHRHFTVHNHSNGRFVYEPKLSSHYRDFQSGVHSCANVKLSAEGLALRSNGPGWAVFEIRSPFIIVPRVGQLDRVEDDCEASVIEVTGQRWALSVSIDNGLTWQTVGEAEQSHGQSRFDVTRLVSGHYGYQLKISLRGRRGDALLRSLRISTWVQVAPASLPALGEGRNELRLVTGDHYQMPTRVVEVRSRASRAEELLKYLVAPPEDYDPGRKTERIRGTVIARVPAPPGTRIAWFTATGQFRTHQQAQAVKTRNQVEFAVESPDRFESLYEADVPTYTNHWHYNVAREHVLAQPARTLFIRYTGDPALNNFAVYAHCLDQPPPESLPLQVVHTWTEQGAVKQAHRTLDSDGRYEVDVGNQPTNVSIELFVKSLAMP
jgi:hypothetical protein